MTRYARLLVLAIAAVGCGACSSTPRMSTPAPLERLSTGSAVHAAVQVERVRAVERAIEAGLPEPALLVLAEIAECEIEHEAAQAKTNTAARAEYEASQAQVAKLTAELQSGTRRWWMIVSLLGGAITVAGAFIAIWFAGIRAQGVMLASLGLLTTGFALGVLAILPWMQWIAIGCIGLAVVVGLLMLTRLRSIAERVVATTDAAKRSMPTDARDAMFSGEAPLADLIQDAPTRAFVRRARKTIPSGERVSSRGPTRPAASAPQADPAIRSSSLEITA